jgi:hypothetical protein
LLIGWPLPWRAAKRRIADHAATRHAHADVALLRALDAGDGYFEDFRRLAIEAPTMHVDTTGGYDPTIEQLVAFVESPCSEPT